MALYPRRALRAHESRMAWPSEAWLGAELTTTARKLGHNAPGNVPKALPLANARSIGLVSAAVTAAGGSCDQFVSTLSLPARVETYHLSILAYLSTRPLYFRALPL